MQSQARKQIISVNVGGDSKRRKLADAMHGPVLDDVAVSDRVPSRIVTKKKKKKRKRLHYVLNDVCFTTKKSVMDKAKRIKATAELLRPIEGGDFKFLLDLFSLHPNWREQRGCGVRCIYVNEYYGWYGKKVRIFFAQRLDGSAFDVSANQIMHPPRNNNGQLMSWCHDLAQGDISSLVARKVGKWSSTTNPPRCELSGEPLRDASQVFAARTVPLPHLVSKFLSERQTNIGGVDNLKNYMLIDRSLRSGGGKPETEEWSADQIALAQSIVSDWLQFHKSHARFHFLKKQSKNQDDTNHNSSPHTQQIDRLPKI